jgi:hypothetical protein
MIARRGRAPIIPIGIYGIGEALGRPGILGRSVIHITLGEPYYPHLDPKGDAEAQTQDLMDRIARLLPPDTWSGAALGSIDERRLRSE